MHDITLYHQPGACSRVALNALEETGAVFTDKALNLARGDQHSPEFLAVNPSGKVATLVFNGQVITENPAILFFIHQQFPDAHLLPWHAGSLDVFQGLSDLIWCASSLHIMVRQLMKPTAFTTEEGKPVWNSGHRQLDNFFQSFEATLSERLWWYGDTWSIVDMYIWWVTETAKVGGFDFSPYPHIIAFQQRIRSRPSFKRAVAKEQQAVIDIEMKLPSGATL